MKRQTLSIPGEPSLQWVRATDHSSHETPLLILGSSLYYPRRIPHQHFSDRPVVYLDLPHFTALEPDFAVSRISLPYYADLVESARRELGLKQVIVLGHSHHGNVAYDYACRYPQSVRGVVMMCSPPANVSETRRAQTAYWDTVASEQRKRILEQRRARFAGRKNDELNEQQQYVAAYVADAPLYWKDQHFDASHLWQGMIFSMAGVGAFRSCFENYHFDARALSRPLLAFTGQYDFAVPPTLWNTVENLPATLMLCHFENSGHTPSLEEPLVFVRQVQRWLSEYGL